MLAKRKAKLFKGLGITRLAYLPFILNVEPGNICNLKCPLCPTGAGETGMEKGFMQLELFKSVFDRLKDSLQAVNMYNWGEPLLNKDFIPMVNYAKAANSKIRITTSTNLNIKDRALLSDLIATGIDEIIVSCDGASAQSYAAYRMGGNFDLVVENMKFLSEKKRELNKDVFIVWNFLAFRHNEHEVGTARRMAKELGVYFRIGLMRTSMKDEILKPHREAIAKDLKWIPDNPLLSAYDRQRLAPKKVIKTCKKPWQEISVNWDGKVFPCCAVYGDRYSFGSVQSDSIENLWNNNMFISARKEIKGKKCGVSTICGICKANGYMHM